jgi:hypothetical protein
MADEKDCQSVPPVHLAQQVQDLGLEGGIERACRFVGDQQLRLVADRQRNPDALAHAARELERVAAQAERRVRNPYVRQQKFGALPGLLPRSIPVRAQGLGQVIADGQHRIEGPARILENHADPASPERSPSLDVQHREIFTVEHHAAGFRFLSAVEQAEQGKRDARFSGAGFADQRQDFAGVQIKRKVTDSRDRPLRGRVLDRQMENGEKRRFRPGLDFPIREAVMRCGHRTASHR